MIKQFRIKGRSQQTYNNKLRALKKVYRLTFKHSKEQKERNMKMSESQRPRKTYFCDKYSSEASFLSTIKLKQPTPKK